MPNNTAKPVVILASGRGSNAQALMEFAERNRDLVKVVGLISDRGGILALDIAKKFSVPSFIVDYKSDEEMEKILQALNPEWACLAGYKRKVSSSFLKFFFDKGNGYYRVLNIHPSLLPAYPGLNGYERAWRDGIKTTGVTVHLVDEGLDTGRPVLQESFPICPEDTKETVEARGLEIEHRLFPSALELAVRGQIARKEGE